MNTSNEETETSDPTMPIQCEVELKKVVDKHTLVGGREASRSGIHELINVNDYSDINKVFRLTAYVLLFVSKARKLDVQPAINRRLLNTAETLWIKAVQSSILETPRYIMWKSQLGIFVDDMGIARCRGRLKNADIPYATQFPVIMPREHPLTILIVKQAHEAVFHNGVKETLTQLRSKYWIVKGRSLVKRILKRCVLCRRMEGLCYVAPPPLPVYRVRQAPPFACTGVDFAGPLFIRMTKTSDCTTKAWICLYTCCVTRAIHLDIVLDMTASSFLRCFKRFTARRGLPRRMVSDNGKTFKGAARTLKRMMSHKDV